MPLHHQGKGIISIISVSMRDSAMKKIPEKRKYMITAAIGLIIAVISLLVRKVFAAASARDVFRILADAFTVPGGLLLAAGLGIWILNQGGFDGLIYMTRVLFRTKTQGKEGSISENEEGRVEPYSEFIIKRHNEQQVTGYSFIIVTAVAFLALSGIFIILYFSV